MRYINTHYITLHFIIGELTCHCTAEGACMRGEEQNREEGEMAQKKLGGGKNRGKK